MAALRLWRRPDGSAAENVDEMAQLEQIGKTTERAKRRVVVGQSSRVAGVTLAPVGPLGRNERAAAIRQTDEQKEHTAAPDAADHRERPALEGVTLAGDRHRIRKITAMGSMPTLPSTR
jgi:hypothetical protein